MKRRISGWSFRLMQEEKVSKSAHFITLTYDTKYVPLTASGYMSLNLRDVQLFFKKYRKACGTCNGPIRYYLAGEYGSKFKRPHYHIILFNGDVAHIQSCWYKGEVHYGTVEEASVGYTLKYISKPRAVPLHRFDDRKPEFAVMSKGLGKSYLSPAVVKYHHIDMDNRMHLTIEGGKKIAMPRYYKDKLYTESERKRIAYFSAQRSDKLRLDYESYMLSKYGESWPSIEAQNRIAAFRSMYKNASAGRKDL